MPKCLFVGAPLDVSRITAPLPCQDSRQLLSLCCTAAAVHSLYCWALLTLLRLESSSRPVDPRCCHELTELCKLCCPNACLLELPWMFPGSLLRYHVKIQGNCCHSVALRQLCTLCTVGLCWLYWLESGSRPVDPRCCHEHVLLTELCKLCCPNACLLELPWMFPGSLLRYHEKIQGNCCALFCIVGLC